MANLDSSDYLGRIAVGRIFNGRVKINDPVTVCKLDGAFHAHMAGDVAEAVIGGDDARCLGAATNFRGISMS